MFNYKIELLTIEGRNYETFERHFEQMAEKGWFLNKFFSGIIIYKKGEPKRVSYSFDYSWRSKDVDGSKYKTNVEYQEFIEESGWQYVDNYGKNNVFINYHPHAESLHSDEILFYKTMMGDGYLNYIVLAMLLMMVFVLMNRNYFGFDFYLSWNNFLKPFAYGGFCLFGIIQMIREIIRRIKDNKLLEMNIVPKADSLTQIQVSSYLFSLLILVNIITYIEIFESIYIILYLIGTHLILALLSYNRLSHSQNGVVFMALSFLLLGCFYFLVDIQKDQVETKLNFERERYASTYYEDTSSPFVEQYLKIEQRCLSNYQENEENVLVEEYFNTRFDWMADKVYEEMMEKYSYSPEDQLAYEECDEVYYSDDHCNLIARKDKQILHLYFEYPEKHDIEGIIQAYFNH